MTIGEFGKGRPVIGVGQITHDPGPEAPSLFVTDQPVDIYTDQGNLGAPTPEAGEVAPVKSPVNRDLENLAVAFSGLSTALAKWGESSVKLDEKKEAYGAEQYALAKALQKQGIPWAEAIASGKLDYLQSPASHRGWAEAEADALVRKAAIEQEANLIQLRNSPGGKDPEAATHAWNSVVDSIVQESPAHLGNSEIFRARVIITQSKFGEMLNSRHRNWVSKQAENTTFDNIGGSVVDLLNVYASMEKAPDASSWTSLETGTSYTDFEAIPHLERSSVYPS